MSEDLGYSSNELEWTCGSGGSVLKRQGSSGWAWAGAIVGALALGATILALIRPHDALQHVSRKLSRAIKHGRHEARETAEELLEGIASAVHHSGPDGHRS